MLQNEQQLFFWGTSRYEYSTFPPNRARPCGRFFFFFFLMISICGAKRTALYSMNRVPLMSWITLWESFNPSWKVRRTTEAPPTGSFSGPDLLSVSPETLLKPVRRGRDAGLRTPAQRCPQHQSGPWLSAIYWWVAAQPTTNLIGCLTTVWTNTHTWPKNENNPIPYNLCNTIRM